MKKLNCILQLISLIFLYFLVVSEINSQGKVGIGIENPNAVLHVNGDFFDDPMFVVSNQGLQKFSVGLNEVRISTSFGAGMKLFTQGDVSFGTLNYAGRLRISNFGNLDLGSDFDPNNASINLIKQGESEGLLIDANQIEMFGNSKLYIQAASSGDISIADGGGNVGIGTLNPSIKLDVVDESWQLRMKNATDGNDWYLGSSGTDWTAGAGKLLISPTGSSNLALFSLTADGNIGLGTANPETRVNIAGGNDVSLGGGGYLSVGVLSGKNMGIDDNEIMSRNNGQISDLFLNAEGGRVGIGVDGSILSDALHLNAPEGQGALRVMVNGTTRFRVHDNGGISFFANQIPPPNGALFEVASAADFTIENLGDEPVFQPTVGERGLIGRVARELKEVRSKTFYASSNAEYKSYSDRRIKENIELIPNALSIISKLKGVQYAIKSDHFYKENSIKNREEIRTNQIGFIAQDVEKILPQLVSVDEQTGLKTVGYMGVIPVTVEAIKELSAKQKKLEKLILEMQKTILEQAKLIEGLKFSKS